MKDFLKKNRFIVGLFTIVIGFIALKIPYLRLPYYWDEAWVYGPAIRTMESTGLGILPNALPPELSRGHPLLFHFLSAGWMKLFGTSVTASHVFPLLVSVLLLVVVYVFGRKIFQHEIVGLMAAGVLALQPIFLAQSGLLLPEVLLALFSLLAIYFYLDKRRFLYVIAGTLALFTKETGIVVIANLLLWTLIESLFSIQEKKWQNYFINSAIVALPIVPFAAFFVCQKLIYGWFFFPEHIALIINSLEKIFNQLERYAAYVFIYQGRNLLTFSAIIALVFMFFHGKKFKNNEGKVILVMLLQIIVGLIFCCLNFYSDRYLMFMIPLLALFFSFIIHKAFDYKWVPLLTLLVVAGLQWPNINKRSNSDHNLGYSDAIKTHQKAIAYLHQNKLQEKKIYTGFLLRVYFQNPYAGYVSAEDKFDNVVAEFNEDVDYAIFSNVEEDIFTQMKNAGKLSKPLIHFESHNAWTEVYKLKN